MTEHGHHPSSGPAGQAPHRGHGLLMIACCIPMLVVAGALVAAGAVSARFLVFAVVCTAMMALMMGGMHEGGRAGADRVRE